MKQTNDKNGADYFAELATAEFIKNNPESDPKSFHEGYLWGYNKDRAELTSKFSPYDHVQVDFGTGIIKGSVNKVHFTESKVFYDLTITGNKNGVDFKTRIYNVDSCFVHSVE